MSEQALREELKAARPVVIWGAGREGLACLELFLKWGWHEGRDFFLIDREVGKVFAEGATSRSEEELFKGDLRCGMVLKAPGIPPAKCEPLLNASGRLESQTSLMLKSFGEKVIGVTGTKGKSTCARLLNDILNRSGAKNLLVGNIGIPAFSLLSDADEADWIVMECSSAQLGEVRHSPRYAIFLNLFEAHLDYHQNMQAYVDAKCRIFDRVQIWGSICVMPRTLQKQLQREWHRRLPAKGGGLLVDREWQAFEADLRDNASLSHRHLRSMLSCVLALCGELGLPSTAISEALVNYQGLPHRLQVEKNPEGIVLVNDSIATVPQPVVAALDAYPQTRCLIVGGRDGGIDQSILINRLKEWQGRLICMSETGRNIAEQLKDKGVPGIEILYVETLDRAAELVREICMAGDVCLFSPGAPSMTPFKNFEHRGEAFLNALGC